MSDAVGWAIWSNIFFGLGIFTWAKTGNPWYGFSAVALGIILQYFYDVWGKWVWKVMGR